MRAHLLTCLASALVFAPATLAQSPYDSPLTRNFEQAVVPCMDGVIGSRPAAERDRICSEASKKLSSLRKWQMMSGEEEMYDLHQATVLAAVAAAQAAIDNGELSRRSCDTMEKAWTHASRLDVNVGAPGDRHEERQRIRDTVYKGASRCREVHGKPPGAPGLY